jgi:uncharacterized protein YeaO (DUF488 family)
MGIRIVRLGSQRHPNEGVRIGTVRRPPRGIPKSEFARQNWYDVWYPNLAPGADTVKLAQQANDPATWAIFAKRYRAEMKQADAARTIELLARLSHGANFSVGCYCEDESHCHRSILRALLVEQGAAVDP